MASTRGELHRLRSELEELRGGTVARAPSVSHALAAASGTLRQWVQPQLHAAMQDAGLTGRRAAALAAVAAGSWLASRRHRHTDAPRSASPALPPILHGTARALRRNAAAPLPAVEVPAVPGERLPITATPPGEITDITRNFMFGIVMPIWMAAGVADWLCHRRARIEDNAGSKESLMHLLMLGEASLPVIGAMVLEITSPMLLLMFAAVVLHGATALWDVSYAGSRRTVTPLEQHVHSYLEMVPVMATAFVTILHWPELRALFGFGDRPPDWSIRRKARPLPGWAVAALLAGTVAFELAPYLEEFRRTRRHAG